MTLQTVKILRLTLGAWTSIAVSYGVAWQLYFVAPIFTTIFLTLPVWIGWKMGTQILIRLFFSLLLGLFISEFLLDFPFICLLCYGLLFYYIYYNDTPSAPPFSTLFLTLGITIVPIMGLSGVGLPHFIAVSLLVNMGAGLVFAWIFHNLFPNTLAQQNTQAAPAKKVSPPPVPSRQERIRLALASSIVAFASVAIFFSLNLVVYAYAMIQICFMVGAANARASLQVMKANAIACCIGGAAIILVFNLLVAVPSYLFLLSLTLFIALFFSRQIFGGGQHAGAFTSGFITFLVLLGSSTMVDKVASSNFYLRIFLILFAGLFAVAGLFLVDRLLRSPKNTLASQIK